MTGSPLHPTPPRSSDPQSWPRQTAASHYSTSGSPGGGLGLWLSGSQSGDMRFLPETLIKGRTLAGRRNEVWGPGLLLVVCASHIAVQPSERPHNVPEQSLGVRQECVFLLWGKPSRLILHPLNSPADNTDLYCPPLQGLQPHRFTVKPKSIYNGYHVSEFIFIYRNWFHYFFNSWSRC